MRGLGCGRWSYSSHCKLRDESFIFKMTIIRQMNPKSLKLSKKKGATLLKFTCKRERDELMSNSFPVLSDSVANTGINHMAWIFNGPHRLEC